MRVMTISAPLRARRIAALVLAASTIVTASGCRDWVVRTKDTESVSIAPTNFEVPVNGSVRVVGTAFDKDNNTISGRRINYSTSNGSVATVTNEGLVIGVSPGQAIVAAESQGKRGETPVTVLPEAPNNILVSPNPVTLRRNNVRQFTATPRNASGTPIAGLTITWQSSNSSIASVSPQGEVTAVNTGNVVITATVNQVSGSSQVTVTEIPIGSIAVAPLSRSVQVNETFQPTVTLRDTANNVISSVNRPLNWSSSSEVVATVTSTGVVQGRRTGTATITAASPANPAINADMQITVFERTVKTVVITPRTGFLRLGIPRQLNAQLLDSLNQAVPGRVITWTSVTPTIASVTATGSTTGLSLGTARIAARVDDAVDTVQFNVTRVPVGEVTITPTQASVIQGRTIPLTVIVKDSVGTEVEDRTVVWLTSNPNTATVVAGAVTGVATGSVTITATAESRSGTASVTVLPVPVDSVSLANPLDSTVTITDSVPGNSKQVQIELLDADGGTVLGRNLLITSSIPSTANATWNQTTRILTITATNLSSGGGQDTIISLRALTAGGNPEGKTTRIRVTVTNPP